MTNTAPRGSKENPYSEREWEKIMEEQNKPPKTPRPGSGFKPQASVSQIVIDDRTGKQLASVTLRGGRRGSSGRIIRGTETEAEIYDYRTGVPKRKVIRGIPSFVKQESRLSIKKAASKPLKPGTFKKTSTTELMKGFDKPKPGEMKLGKIDLGGTKIAGKRYAKLVHVTHKTPDKGFGKKILKFQKITDTASKNVMELSEKVQKTLKLNKKDSDNYAIGLVKGVLKVPFKAGEFAVSGANLATNVVESVFAVANIKNLSKEEKRLLNLEMKLLETDAKEAFVKAPQKVIQDFHKAIKSGDSDAVADSLVILLAVKGAKESLKNAKTSATTLEKIRDTKDPKTKKKLIKKLKKEQEGKVKQQANDVVKDLKKRYKELKKTKNPVTREAMLDEMRDIARDNQKLIDTLDTKSVVKAKEKAEIKQKVQKVINTFTEQAKLKKAKPEIKKVKTIVKELNEHIDRSSIISDPRITSKLVKLKNKYEIDALKLAKEGKSTKALTGDMLIQLKKIIKESKSIKKTETIKPKKPEPTVKPKKKVKESKPKSEEVKPQEPSKTKEKTQTTKEWQELVLEEQKTKQSGKQIEKTKQVKAKKPGMFKPVKNSIVFDWGKIKESYKIIGGQKLKNIPKQEIILKQNVKPKQATELTQRINQLILEDKQVPTQLIKQLQSLTAEQTISMTKLRTPNLILPPKFKLKIQALQSQLRKSKNIDKYDLRYTPTLAGLGENIGTIKKTYSGFEVRGSVIRPVKVIRHKRSNLRNKQFVRRHRRRQPKT